MWKDVVESFRYIAARISIYSKPFLNLKDDGGQIILVESKFTEAILSLGRLCLSIHHLNLERTIFSTGCKRQEVKTIGQKL